MREFKFRIWDTKNKRYIDSHSNGIEFIGDLFYLTLDGKVASLMKGVDLQDYIIEQYTGLKDCHGKEIYEGDILGYTSKFEDRSLYEIRWADTNYGERWCEFVIADYDGNKVEPKILNYYGGINTQFTIVVGNIHEKASRTPQ